MGLINFRNCSLLVVHCLLLITSRSLLTAQTFGPAGSLAAELQRLDAIIQDAGGGDAKKEALSTKAQLLEMSGDIEEAANIWYEAAFAEPNKRNDKALLRSAVCFAAMGEYSRADAALKTILLTGSDAANLRDARYLAAQTEVLRNGEKAFPLLISFLENPEYVLSKPGIYYLLWKLSGSEDYKAKLITDFPESPEAGLAREINTSITPAFTPMWLLFSGREQVVVSHNTVTNADVEPENSPSDSADESPVLIQVGLFSKEENAQAMIDRLNAKGFNGTISRKTVSGTTYLQVTLPPGADSNQTIMRLKDAGFESFPVFSDSQ